MKQQWQNLAARLDTRNQRERAMISAMVLVVVASLLNTLMLEPQLLKKKKLTQEVTAQQTELVTLRSQIQATMSGGKIDPDAAIKVRLAELQQKLAQSDAALQSMQDGLVPPDKMARLLEDVLAQNRALKLVSLKTLSASNVLDAPAKTAKPVPESTEKNAEAPPPDVPAIYKHGVEIAVSGSYAELTQYLDALEKLPWRMIWGKAEMQVEEYPRVTLKITLYTLSMEEKWMAI